MDKPIWRGDNRRIARNGPYSDGMIDGLGDYACSLLIVNRRKILLAFDSPLIQASIADLQHGMGSTTKSRPLETR